MIKIDMISWWLKTNIYFKNELPITFLTFSPWDLFVTSYYFFYSVSGREKDAQEVAHLATEARGQKTIQKSNLLDGRLKRDVINKNVWRCQ